MSTRVVDSKTVLAIGTISPEWDAFDRYRRNSDGGNTPKLLRLQNRFTENQYDCSIIFERNDPFRTGTNTNGPFNWIMGGQVLGGVPGPLSAIPYPDPYSLMGKLEARWKSSKFNAGVFAAEGKDALDMMVSRMAGLDRSLRALRRGNVGRALRELTGQVPRASRGRMVNRVNVGDVSGAWLEAHLGWSPMISDVYNAAGLLELRERSNRVRVANFNEVSLKPSGNPMHWTVVGNQRKYQSIVVECKRAASLIENLGLTDPASVAWEATRLSFVADWFLPIGSSLANFHAVGAVPVERVIHTNYSRLEGVSTPNLRNVGGMWIHPDDVHNHCYMKAYEVKRRIYDSLFPLIGTLGWLPGSVSPKWDPSVWKLATLSALVHQGIAQLKGRTR